MNFLQKNAIKLDVYLSKDNKPVQIGRAEIFLRELVTSDIVDPGINSKTPVVQRWAKVFPVPGLGASNDAMNQPLGIIKFKMRLRNHI